MVIEAEIKSISERDFAYLRPAVSIGIGNKPHADLLRRLLDNLAEVPKTLDRGKAVWFENQLRFKIVHFIERRAVCIRCRHLRVRRTRSGTVYLESSFLRFLFLLVLVVLLVFFHGSPLRYSGIRGKKLIPCTGCESSTAQRGNSISKTS